MDADSYWTFLRALAGSTKIYLRKKTPPHVTDEVFPSSSDFYHVFRYSARVSPSGYARNESGDILMNGRRLFVRAEVSQSSQRT